MNTCTLEDLKSMTFSKLSFLEKQNPPHKNNDLRMWSAQKWICREILRDIKTCEEAPFVVTPLDILEDFQRKINNRMCDAKNENRVDVYVEAYDMVTWIMEDLGI